MARKRVSSKKQDVNDLEILFPDRSVTIAERSITVREYSFVEGQRLLYLAEPFIRELNKNYVGIPSFAQVKNIIFKYSYIICQLISRACELSIKDINDASIDEGIILYETWWEVNKYVVSEAFSEKTTTQTVSWGELFAYLVSKGFSHNQLANLTLRQIKFYFEALNKLDRRKMASHITAISIGFNGGKEATKIVKELQK